MSWEFRPGMKVVAIVTREHPSAPGASLVKGRIYTIREIITHPTEEGVGLRLHEITMPLHPRLGIEFAWRSKRFRPLVKRETDISIFKALLTPSKAKESA